jgi:hypothetical protein
MALENRRSAQIPAVDQKRVMVGGLTRPAADVLDIAQGAMGYFSGDKAAICRSYC